MSLLDSLPHRCSIFLLVPGIDSYGGNTNVPTEEKADVECWEQAASSEDVEEFDKRGILIKRKIFFKEDPSLTEKHVIKITSRDRGVTIITSPPELRVKTKSLPDASAGLGLLYKVMVDDQTGGNQ